MRDGRGRRPGSYTFLAMALAAAFSATCASRTLRFRQGGIEVTAFGEDYAAAMAELVSRFGEPDDPGRARPGIGSCGMVELRDVRWGDLTVTFTDLGEGLHLSGFVWGDIQNRNTRSPHPAPSGPARPSLPNPWELEIGAVVSDPEALAREVAAQLPGARFIEAPRIFDPAIAGPFGDRTLNLGLHAIEGGYLLERLWVFDPREIFCGR